jgi:hypothetical protein
MDTFEILIVQTHVNQTISKNLLKTMRSFKISLGYLLKRPFRVRLEENHWLVQNQIET